MLTRLLHTLLVVWTAASMAFLLLHLAPGDPIAAMADASRVPPEQRAVWRAQQGFDQPLAVQYGRWLGQVARADFGFSTSQQRPTRDVLASRLPNTLLLMGLALLTSIAAGAKLGAWQGARADSWGDRALSTLMLVLYSVPEFWVALLLLLLFTYYLPVLPATGMVDAAFHDQMGPWAQLKDRAAHLVLPWLSLTLMGTAVFARVQRAAVRERWREPFVITAFAKGLADTTVRRQVWRTALLPVVTMAGLFLPAILTGAVFVERIFGWPGIGSALLQAIAMRDYALVSACVVMGSAVTTMGSFLADLTGAWLDPRMRTG
jgi:peptide/nickel transport system permease protein